MPNTSKQAPELQHSGASDYPSDKQLQARISAASVKADELRKLQHRTPEQQRLANLVWMRKALNA